jgi:hypothetical protein
MGEVIGLSRRKLLNILMREMKGEMFFNLVSFFPGARNVFGHIDRMRALLHVSCVI